MTQYSLEHLIFNAWIKFMKSYITRKLFLLHFVILSLTSLGGLCLHSGGSWRPPLTHLILLLRTFWVNNIMRGQNSSYFNFFPQRGPSKSHTCYIYYRKELLFVTKFTIYWHWFFRKHQLILYKSKFSKMLFFQIFGYYILQINSVEKNYNIWKF